MAQQSKSPPAWLVTVAIAIVSQITTASGIYAAIRADLREVQVRVSILERQAERREDATR